MTQAICFKCGATKHGAFTLCKSCQTRPLSEDDLIKSLALTDHHLSKFSLDQAGKLIQDSQLLEFEPEQLEILRSEVKSFLETPMGRMLIVSSTKMPTKKWWQFWI